MSGTSTGNGFVQDNTQLYTQLQNLIAPYLGAAGQGYSQFINGPANYAPGQLDDLLKQIQQFTSQAPGLLSNPASLPPALQQMLTALGGGIDRATDLTNTGGQTQDSRYLRERLLDTMGGNTPDAKAIQGASTEALLNGGMVPGLFDLRSKGSDLMANGGMTPQMSGVNDALASVIGRGGATDQTDAALKQFLGTISGGGRDAGTQGLVNTGQGLMANGGFTPQMQSLMDQVQKGIATGGMSPEMRQIFDQIMPIIKGGDGVLQPLAQVQSFAQDAAGKATMDAGEAARRQAFARTGSGVGSGLTGQDLLQFGAKSAEAQAAALRDATMSQQDLMLKQLTAALGTGADLGKTAGASLLGFLGTGSDLTKTGAANIGTGADLMKSGETVAANRFATGTAGFNDTLKNVIANLTASGNIFTDNNKTALGRATLGGDLSLGAENSALKNRDSGLAGLQGLLQNSLGAGSELNKVGSTEASSLNAALQSLIGLTGQGSQITQNQQKLQLDQGNQQIAGFGLQGNLLSDQITKWLQSVGGYTDIAKVWGGGTPGTLGNIGSAQSGTIQAASQPAWWQGLLNTAVGGAASGLSGGVAGLIGGPKKP